MYAVCVLVTFYPLRVHCGKTPLQDLKDLSHRHVDLCKELIHHQHLQHQGWRTVVANLEDTRQALIDQADKFSDWFTSLLNKKHAHVDMLHRCVM